jgi:glycerophosphoryl diester phosphodiesterase
MGAMSTRLPSLLDRALLLAHRGGRAVDAAGAIAAFTAAVDSGASGIHADAWVTADGVAVLSRDGLHRRFPRRRVGDVTADRLHEGVARLDDVLAAVGGVPVSLRVHDPGRLAPVLDAARRHGGVERLWLVHHDLEILGELREAAPGARLVNEATLDGLPHGPERRAAELAAARVDAVLFPEPAWSGGLVTLFHRFEVLAFAADAQHERQLVRLIDMGVDGVVGDHVERMVAVAATFDRR